MRNLGGEGVGDAANVCTLAVAIEGDGDCCHQMMRVEGSLGLVLRITEMASGLKYLLTSVPVPNQDIY